MTKQRDLKRLIRERMGKTGERYSAARARILAQRAAAPTASPFGPCGGTQSETGVLTNALRRVGVRDAQGNPLDETLVFGLCGGIGFLYAVFEYKGIPPMLTIVARARSMPRTFLGPALERCGARVETLTTSSPSKAQRQLDEAHDAGHPVLAVVDRAALGYYGWPAMWLGMSPHIVGVLRDDAGELWLDDRGARPVSIDAKQLLEARGVTKKSKHALMVFRAPEGDFDLDDAIWKALADSVAAYNEAPAKPFASNIGTAGLEKWARLLTDERDKKGWPKVFKDGAHAYVGLRRIYDCIEHEYTAPHASRPTYAAFLRQAAGRLEVEELGAIADEADAIGQRWADIASTIVEAGDPAVTRGCAISDRRAELLDTADQDPTKEMRELWLERKELGRACRLDAAGAKALYGELATIVNEIAERERDLNATLAQVVG